MPKRKAVLGRLVLSQGSGAPVGRVEDMVLDTSCREVLGVLVRGDGLGYYDLKELVGYAADVLEVVDRGAALPPRAVRSGGRSGAWGRALLGKRVVDDRGGDRGVLDDFWFDARSGRLTRWVLSDSVLGDLVTGRPTVPAPPAAAIGPDAIVVPRQAFGEEGGDPA